MHAMQPGFLLNKHNAFEQLSNVPEKANEEREIGQYKKKLEKRRECAGTIAPLLKALLEIDSRDLPKSKNVATKYLCGLPKLPIQSFAHGFYKGQSGSIDSSLWWYIGIDTFQSTTSTDIMHCEYLPLLKLFMELGSRKMEKVYDEPLYHSHVKTRFGSEGCAIPESWLNLTDRNALYCFHKHELHALGSEFFKGPFVKPCLLMKIENEIRRFKNYRMNTGFLPAVVGQAVIHNGLPVLQTIVVNLPEYNEIILKVYKILNPTAYASKTIKVLSNSPKTSHADDVSQELQSQIRSELSTSLFERMMPAHAPHTSFFFSLPAEIRKEIFLYQINNVKL